MATTTCYGSGRLIWWAMLHHGCSACSPCVLSSHPARAPRATRRRWPRSPCGHQSLPWMAHAEADLAPSRFRRPSSTSGRRTATAAKGRAEPPTLYWPVQLQSNPSVQQLACVLYPFLSPSSIAWWYWCLVNLFCENAVMRLEFKVQRWLRSRETSMYCQEWRQFCRFTRTSII